MGVIGTKLTNSQFLELITRHLIFFSNLNQVYRKSSYNIKTNYFLKFTISLKMLNVIQELENFFKWWHS